MNKILIILLGILLLSACNDNSSTPEKITYESEQDSLVEAIENKAFTNAIPDTYTFSATIDLLLSEDADRIEYEIFVQSPKIKMDDVTLSFHLEPIMLSKLNTSHVFQTNTAIPDSINISPNGDLQGASLSRAFVLDPERIDKDAIKNYRTVYVKVSYLEDDIRNEQYFKVEAVPSSDIENYMTKHSK